MLSIGSNRNWVYQSKVRENDRKKTKEKITAANKCGKKYTLNQEKRSKGNELTFTERKSRENAEKNMLKYSFVAFSNRVFC